MMPVMLVGKQPGFINCQRKRLPYSLSPDYRRRAMSIKFVGTRAEYAVIEEMDREALHLNLRDMTEAE